MNQGFKSVSARLLALCCLLVGSELELELGDRHGRVETFRTRSRTVKDSVASVHAHLILQFFASLLLVRVLIRKTERKRSEYELHEGMS